MIAAHMIRTLAAGGLLLTTIVAVRGDGQPTTRQTALGGADRYLSAVSTDKPIYKAGEKVYIRSVVLRADNHTPLAGQAQALVEIKGPKGDTVASGMAQAQDSVVGFSWEVPQGQAGGEYTAKVAFPFEGYTPAERKFDIRAYRAPRLKTQIVFVRDGYGPGDSVNANLHADRAEGGIPANAKVSVIARVDGAEVAKSETRIDANGNCSALFKLPAEITRGEGTLAMIIEDGGTVETATKTIPILLQTVDLAMYPEGGDLVAGLPGRVYLEARTPAKKPADIAGVVVDDKGKEVATFRTQHEGRGKFAFVPDKGIKYTLKITEPAGIKTPYALPAVKDSGAIITALEEVTPAGKPVRLRVIGTERQNLKVTLAKREVELASAVVKPMPLPAGDTDPAAVAAWYQVELTPPAEGDGVMIATAWDEKGTPLAERLVYRQPAKGLVVEVTSDQSSYTPADKVSLKITTKDEVGKPVGAVVGLTVTDDSVLEMIEKREQAPRLPVMVLLESDVRELADAHVYLDKSNPKATVALDLLLGTQGWRRFAFVDSAKFLPANGDAAKRVLALRMPDERRMMPMGVAAGGMGRGGMMRNAAAKADGAMPPPVAPAAAKPEGNMILEDAVVAPPAVLEPAKDMRAAEEQFQKKEADKPIMGDRMAASRPMPVRQDFIVVREYAHVVRPGRIEGDRVDFTETLFWNAGVKTDDKTGEATVSFSLSDAVTTFRVFADAFDKGGALGSTSTPVESVQPFYIEPKMPLEVTQGDSVLLPIGMVNGMTRDLPLARITAIVPAGITVGEADNGFTLKGKERVRRLLTLDIGQFAGTPNINLEAHAGPYADKVARPMTVVPMGFPIEWANGGMLESGATVKHLVTIPKDVVAGSISTKVAVYPTPLGNLTAALERLIQEPGGCFEQTSSTSYPLVMAQQYFLTHQGVDPKLIERSRNHLDSAYKKLVGFECKQKGYEWFGGDPGHEALTAYGLLQFSDMKEVRQVDPDMLKRTRQWLLDKRDGKGGFVRNARALDSFGRAPQETTDAYVVWALLEAGETGLEKEVAAIKANALKTDDSYVLALASNILAMQKDAETAKSLMAKLAKKQDKDGAVDGGATSITQSGGDALKIETTALTILAWMREPTYAGQVEKSMHWLLESCKAGRFGSTQSTILALRAIVNYDKAHARPKAPGTVTLIVDGKTIGQPVPFGPDTQGALALPDATSLLTPGEHAMELKMEKGAGMPYAMAVNFFNTQPASSDQCKLALAVTLKDQQVQEGAVTEATVKVTNKDKEAIPTPVAIIGIPGGLEVRHDQLKELVKSGKIDAYEVVGRQVVLYWRGMKADTTVELPISLVAAIPGTYTAPASRAYLYYTDEHKQWVPGVKVTIAAK